MQPDKNTSDPRQGTVWGGYGENKPCHVCARPISNNEVQIDVDAGSAGSPLVFHQRCYDIWANWVPG